jgi:hypothetical protein
MLALGSMLVTLAPRSRNAEDAIPVPAPTSITTREASGPTNRSMPSYRPWG